jgi:transposase
MHVRAHHPNDLKRLSDISRKETDAKQRDRCRAVLLALEGQSTPAIMTTLDRSGRFVQRWVYLYRDGGIDALCPKRQTGHPRKLTGHEEAQLRDRILAGAKPQDAVCSLRGQDIRRIIHSEFGVAYSLPAVYVVLHRLGLSCLQLRPKHKKNDLQKMRQWLQDAPLLSKESEKKGRIKS